MKKYAIVLVSLLILATKSAWAAGPSDIRTAPKTVSLGDITPTQDMWFYEQYLQQYQDPKLAVRKKAEARSEARDQRLAALRWFGLSNSRPRANTDPMHTDYSPRWAANNAVNPDLWLGVGPNYIPVPVERSK